MGIGGGGIIGGVVAGLLSGFGRRLLGDDVQPDAALTQRYGVAYGPLDTLCARADVVALHVLLTPGTRQLFNAGRLANMQWGAVLVNTNRGARQQLAAKDIIGAAFDQLPRGISIVPADGRTGWASWWAVNSASVGAKKYLL